MLAQRKAPLRLVLGAWFFPLLTAITVSWPMAATAAPTATGRLVVESGERSGLYSLGREVVFTIQPGDGAEAVDPEKVTVTITRDGWEKLVPVQTRRNGEAVEVRFTPQAPGWYMCEASPVGDGSKAAAGRAGVLVSPERIAPSMPEPNDFENLSRLRRGLCFAASEIVVSSVGPSRSGVI